MLIKNLQKRGDRHASVDISKVENNFFSKNMSKNMSENNPLRELLVNESQPIDLQELAKILKAYVVINENSKKIDFFESFHNLSNELKILIILAASKARSILLKTEEKLSPTEIIGLDVMPEGSVKGTLKKLLESHEIKSERSKYSLPNYQIRQLVSRLNSEASK